MLQGLKHHLALKTLQQRGIKRRKYSPNFIYRQYSRRFAETLRKLGKRIVLF